MQNSGGQREPNDAYGIPVADDRGAITPPFWTIIIRTSQFVSCLLVLLGLNLPLSFMIIRVEADTLWRTNAQVVQMFAVEVQNTVVVLLAVRDRDLRILVFLWVFFFEIRNPTSSKTVWPSSERFWKKMKLVSKMIMIMMHRCMIILHDGSWISTLGLKVVNNVGIIDEVISIIFRPKCHVIPRLISEIFAEKTVSMVLQERVLE